MHSRSGGLRPRIHSRRRHLAIKGRAEEVTNLAAAVGLLLGDELAGVLPQQLVLYSRKPGEMLLNTYTHAYRF